MKDIVKRRIISALLIAGSLGLITAGTATEIEMEKDKTNENEVLSQEILEDYSETYDR